MKTIKMVAAVLVAAAVSFNAVADKGKKAAPASINVDTQKSTLGWYGKKFTGDHNGTINITKGSLQVDKAKLVGGSFDIDMNSIVCKDVTDANYNAKLVNHLKSDDFFNAAQFPVSTFKITKVAPIAGAKAGEPNTTITGDLTIRGVANPVSFPATVGLQGGNVTASAKIVVDRSKYNVKYGSKSFFANIGDKVIYDEFEMTVNLVAGK